MATAAAKTYSQACCPHKRTRRNPTLRPQSSTNHPSLPPKHPSSSSKPPVIPTPLRHLRPTRHPRESGDPGPRLHNPPTIINMEMGHFSYTYVAAPGPRHPRHPTRHPRESGDPDPRLHNPPTIINMEMGHFSYTYVDAPGPRLPRHPTVIPAKAGTQTLVSPTHQRSLP